jgi:hypothetical protein
MAFVFTPTCPGTGPWYIDREDCIGDSLVFINANTGYFDCRINSAQGFFKNKLINAQGLINQRVYVSGTATLLANQYTLDRWRVVTLGQNLTFTRDQNVTTFTAPAAGVEQVIEGLNLETDTYTLKWIGNATATVNGTPVSNGGTISLTGGSNATVKFIGGTFSLPQLEKGNTPTSFEYRAFGTELALCQRYFCKSFPLNVRPAANTIPGCILVHEPIGKGAGTIHATQGQFPVSMRTTPVITFYNPNANTAINTVYLTSTTSNLGTVYLYIASPDRLSYFQVSSSFGGTEPVASIRACHWHFTANAEF